MSSTQQVNRRATYQPLVAPRAAEPVVPQRGTRVQSWAGVEILAQCRSSELLDAYRAWTKIAEQQLPRLGDMTGPQHYQLPDHAGLLLRLPTDFLFVTHGVAAQRMMGRNYTGLLHSELRSPVVKEIEAVYLSCLEHRRPLYLRYVSQISERHFSLEQIAFPLAADQNGEPTFILFHAAALDDKADILRAVFDHSPIGMIAALPARGEGAKPDDGRILLINAHAKRILKLPDSMDRINSVRDLGPWFRDGALWTRTTTVSEGRQTHIHYRDRASGTSYRLTIEPISRFMLFSIIEVLA